MLPCGWSQCLVGSRQKLGATSTVALVLVRLQVGCKQCKAPFTAAVLQVGCEWYSTPFAAAVGAPAATPQEAESKALEDLFSFPKGELKGASRQLQAFQQ